MARIRSIKPEFPQSETVGRLSRDARLLFVQLWTIADDAGRLRGASRMLASLLYPYDDDAPALIDAWLTELMEKDCIRCYSVDGAQYVEIINWLKHQKIDRPSASRIPQFDEASTKPREESRASDADLGPRTKDKDLGEEDTSLRSDSGGKYYFESGVIRLAKKDFEKWRDAYQHLDLKAELLSLTQWAGEQENWFFAVAGALAKRNREQKLKLAHAQTPQGKREHEDFTDPEWRKRHRLDGII